MFAWSIIILTSDAQTGQIPGRRLKVVPMQPCGVPRPSIAGNLSVQSLFVANSRRLTVKNEPSPGANRILAAAHPNLRPPPRAFQPRHGFSFHQIS
jgi:hypothetical protein